MFFLSLLLLSYLLWFFLLFSLFQKINDATFQNTLVLAEINIKFNYKTLPLFSILELFYMIEPFSYFDKYFEYLFILQKCCPNLISRGYLYTYRYNIHVQIYVDMNKQICVYIYACMHIVHVLSYTHTSTYHAHIHPTLCLTHYFSLRK